MRSVAGGTGKRELAGRFGAPLCNTLVKIRLQCRDELRLNSRESF